MSEPAAAVPAPPVANGPHGQITGLLPRWFRYPAIILAFLSLCLVLFAPAFLYADNTHRLTLFGRCLALAILALGVDLIWGYTGMLSLGQSLYFGLGAYIVAYSLKLKEAAKRYNDIWRTDVPVGVVPADFMVNYGAIDVTDPDYVQPTILSLVAPLGNIWLAFAVAIALPMLIAFLFGLLAFHRRIKGVYFSLLTQALVLAAFFLADNQQPLTGGRPGINEISHLELNGFTFDRSRNAASKVPEKPEDFQSIFGLTLNRNRGMWDLYLLNATVLVVSFLGCVWLVRSKFGKILAAIRDNENRVMALGYNTAMYKVFAFTLAGGLAGLGGALFVPVVGKMGPTYIGVIESIYVVIYVAVGGRGTLLGAILGTFLVHSGYSSLSEVPSSIREIVLELRPILLGGLFVAVVLFMPSGILGMLQSLAGWLKQTLLHRSNGAGRPTI
jgi:urea transport system permease protein